MPPRRRPRAAAAAALLALAALLAALGPRGAAAQLSRARTDDTHWISTGSKFLARTAENDKADEKQQFDDVPEGDECPMDIELRWMTQVTSSVYATPLITDLYSDGRKDIIVPGFVHYTEVLQGVDGAQALGWPAFHASTVHASPLLHDWDLDGTPDVLVATYDAEVVAFKDTGERLSQSLRVPRLRVRRNWFVGVNPDPVDHSHPDVGAAAAAFETHAAGKHKAGHHKGKHVKPHKSSKPDSPSPSPAAGAATQPPAASPSPAAGQAQAQQQQPPAPAAAQPPPAPAAQQQQQQPAAGAGGGAAAQGTPAPGSTLSPSDQAAVLKLRENIEGLRTKYGQKIADQLLERTRARNPKLYSDYQELMETERKLADLAGSFGGGGGAAQRRRLLWAEGGEGDGGGAAAGRRLQQVAAGGGKPVAAGAEFDAAKQGLSQEALDSFQLFEDGRAPAGAPAGGAQQQQEGGGGEAGGGAGAGGRPLIEPAPEAFDEFGDRLSALEERDAAAEEGRGGPAYDPFDADDYGPGGPGGGKGGGGGGAEGGGGGGAEGGGGEGALEGGAKGGESQLGKDTDWGWRDEMFDQGSHHVTSEFVYVDPHVLTTPAIADIDGDGHDELVLAVSYFFDKDYYDDPAHAGELGGDVQKT
ncbi:MAG: hypothetical protein J3K34DRAFT_492220, partial [Monoraphidium minutum]